MTSFLRTYITFCELGLQMVLHFEILTISAQISGVSFKCQKKKKKKKEEEEEEEENKLVQHLLSKEFF